MISPGPTSRVMVGLRPGPTVTRMSTLNSSNSTFSGSTPALTTVPRLPAGPPPPPPAPPPPAPAVKLLPLHALSLPRQPASETW